MLDLGGPLSDPEGKKSKFRFLQFFYMVTKKIYMRFKHSPIKTVGGVRENVQNRQKNGNDLRDLDFDLVTLRSSGYADLVHTYL